MEPPRPTSRRRLLVVLSLLLVLGTGAWMLTKFAGPVDRKMRVWGEVSCAGEPIKEGEIVFTPIANTTGPATGIAIIDGAYDVPAASGPLAGGTY